jgi:hypothetical protein
MVVYTWEKDTRDEIIKRRLEKGTMAPTGVKILSEWTAVGRNIDYALVEAEDAKLLSQMSVAWTDIIDMDIQPVIDTEKDLLGLLKGAV